jgi:hypothetical protein
MDEEPKYVKEKNSDELSQKFHDKAGQISRDLNQQLLSLSTAIIGAFFVLAFNNDCLTLIMKFLIIAAISSFGLTILFIVKAMQSDSSKNYFLGLINDSTKQDLIERKKNEEEKVKYNNRQLKERKLLRVFFLLGVLFSILILINYLFQNCINGL